MPNELVPITVAEVEKIADHVFKSNLFPAIKTKEAAFTLMMLCQAEGLHPMQALKRYHVMHDGRPAMRADAMLAEFMHRGGSVEWITEADDRNTQRAKWTKDGRTKEIGFTIQEAKSAGYIRPGSNWEKDPASQLRARAISRAIRMLDPGIIAGIYTPEELEEIRPDAAAPARPAPAAQPEAEDAVVTPVASPAEDPAGTEEQKRMRHLRGKLNQALQACDDSKGFQRVQSDFQREHGKAIWEKATEHRAGETFNTLRTEHWGRISSAATLKLQQEALATMPARLEACQDQKAFFELEKEAEANPLIRDNANVQDLFRDNGKRLGLSGYVEEPSEAPRG